MTAEFDTLFEEPTLLAAMREQAQVVGHPDAAREIAQKILWAFSFTNYSPETKDQALIQTKWN